MPETRSKGRRRKSILQRIKPFFGRLRRKDGGPHVRSPTSVANFWQGSSVNENSLIPEVEHNEVQYLITDKENRQNQEASNRKLPKEQKPLRGEHGDAVQSFSPFQDENEEQVRIRCLDTPPVKDILIKEIRETSVGELLRDFSHPEPAEPAIERASKLSGLPTHCDSCDQSKQDPDNDKQDPDNDNDTSSNQKQVSEEPSNLNEKDDISGNRESSNDANEDVDTRSVEAFMTDHAKSVSTDIQNFAINIPQEEEKQHDETVALNSFGEEFEAQSQSSGTPFEDCIDSLDSKEEESNASFDTADDPKTQIRILDSLGNGFGDKHYHFVEYHKEQNEAREESDEENQGEIAEDNDIEAQNKENQPGPEELFARGDVVIVEIVGGAYASCRQGRINDIRKRVQVAIQHSDGTTKLHWLARGSLTFHGSPFPAYTEEGKDEVKTKVDKDASGRAKSESTVFQINDRVCIIGGKYKKYKLGTVVEVKTSVKVAVDGFDGNDPWLRRQSLKLCDEDNSP